MENKTPPPAPKRVAESDAIRLARADVDYQAAEFERAQDAVRVAGVKLETAHAKLNKLLAAQ